MGYFGEVRRREVLQKSLVLTTHIVIAPCHIHDSGNVAIICCIEDHPSPSLRVADQTSHTPALSAQIQYCCSDVLFLC